MRASLAALLFTFCCHAAVMAACGDGIIDPLLEQCDHGAANGVLGDCCSSMCQFEAAGTVCRPPAGVCDAEETCDGTNPVCPVDAKKTDVCRPAAGECDVAESCDGGNDCPPDAFAPATTVCRSAAGICDVEEVCTGFTPACPPDVKSTAVCRPAAGACDAEESCDGISNDCPLDEPAPNGTACNDGDACTRTDACASGVCVGSNAVVCTALDSCHVAGACNPATGVCSNPAKPDTTPCNDGNPCTSADSCKSGLCRGLPLQGCCLVDGECEDGFACTQDRCVRNACTHAALDERCGPPGDCAAFMCVPGDPAAGTNGCVSRPFGEGGYCSEDADPCTIDACRSGVCRHDSDGSGAGCAALAPPYRLALDLLAQTSALQAALQTAIAVGCPAGGKPPLCDLVPGDEPTRLVSLLQAAELDVRSAALALAGRLTASTVPADPARDPFNRARIALGLLGGTPGDLRGFLATLAQARTHRVVAAAFARSRRLDGRRLLGGTGKLRRQLQRLVFRRQSFAQ